MSTIKVVSESSPRRLLDNWLSLDASPIAGYSPPMAPQLIVNPAPTPTATHSAVFVDLENLLGKPYLPMHRPRDRRPGAGGRRLYSPNLGWASDDVASVKRALQQIAPASSLSLSAIAVCRTHFVSLRLAWGTDGWWIDAGNGPDAADRALLACMNDWDFGRATRVVIASGDHAFAMTARRLRVAGIRVEVVARQGSISRALAQEADHIHLLPEARRAAA